MTTRPVSAFVSYCARAAPLLYGENRIRVCVTLRAAGRGVAGRGCCTEMRPQGRVIAVCRSPLNQHQQPGPAAGQPAATLHSAGRASGGEGRGGGRLASMTIFRRTTKRWRRQRTIPPPPPLFLILFFNFAFPLFCARETGRKYLKCGRALWGPALPRPTGPRVISRRDRDDEGVMGQSVARLSSGRRQGLGQGGTAARPSPFPRTRADRQEDTQGALGAKRWTSLCRTRNFFPQGEAVRYREAPSQPSSRAGKYERRQNQRTGARFLAA